MSDNLSADDLRAVRELIGQYVQAATSAANEMRKTYGVHDLYAAYLTKQLPQKGPVSAERGGTYRFHGVGYLLRNLSRRLPSCRRR